MGICKKVLCHKGVGFCELLWSSPPPSHPYYIPKGGAGTILMYLIVLETF